MKINLVARILAGLPGLGFLQKDAHTPLNIGADGPYGPVNLTVLREEGNRSSPHLHGIMFEEMDRSGDGGIHGNLLRNNGFQGANPGLVGYKSVGQTEIMRSLTPVSPAIQSSLAVLARGDAEGLVGFANIGYDGVPVDDALYRTSFYMKGDYEGPVVLRLVGTENGTVYGSRNLTVTSSKQTWEKHQTTIEAKASDVGANEWQVLFDAAIAKGKILKFGLVELFPPTFNNRSNGLRADIAQVVADLNPSFLRFPGGNNLEGIQIDSRWKWNETIGPLINRPGRASNWHYPNTDALGLDEYLWWCEDMGMAPVLAVWDGKSYGGIVPGDAMQPYLDDILNELEYLLGPNTSDWGAVRAANGRNEPWNVQFIEIGNEDDYSGGCDTYPDRLIRIYDTIHDAYPNITLIANNMEKWCLPEAPLPGMWHDYHYYRSADDLVKMFNYWDHQPRNEPVLIGEYGCREDGNPDGVFWTVMQGSCAEAAHMIGLERNSDVVMMAAYAPLLQHFGFTQWSPTLFGFDSRPGSLTLSTSYYVNKMFSNNQGNTVHPVNSTADFGPLYWVATSNETAWQIKLANYGMQNETVNIRVPDMGVQMGTGKLEMISGPSDASNLPFNVTVTPTMSDVTLSMADGYTVVMPPWGVAVLVINQS
ncbi:glycoside hydrolase superfamily [Aspergillus unguis]